MVKRRECEEEELTLALQQFDQASWDCVAKQHNPVYMMACRAVPLDIPSATKALMTS